MSEEYKRMLCVACPFEADCRYLREEMHCDTCPEALVCGAKGLLARHDCDYIRRLWQELPRKCLLVGSRLKEKTIDPMELFQYVSGAPGGDGEESNEACYICPRCNQPSLAVGNQHTFRSRLDRPLKKSEETESCTIGVAYYASCRVCGVDDVHKT